MATSDRSASDGTTTSQPADRTSPEKLTLDAFRQLELALRQSEDARRRADSALRSATARDRSSRRLDDVVIQRLFGVGLRLLALRPVVTESTAGRLDEIVADLDATIEQLRDALTS